MENELEDLKNEISTIKNQKSEIENVRDLALQQKKMADLEIKSYTNAKYWIDIIYLSTKIFPNLPTRLIALKNMDTIPRG